MYCYFKLQKKDTMEEFKLDVGREFGIMVRKEEKKNKSRNAVWRGEIVYFPRDFF